MSNVIKLNGYDVRDPAAVHYDTADGMTDAQKTQARENTGAASAAELSAANDNIATLAGADAVFVQNANDTQSNYYKTFTALSIDKVYVFTLTVTQAGSYTLLAGTSNSSAAMVDTVGTADLEANGTARFIYRPTGAYTYSRLSSAIAHTLTISEIVNVADLPARLNLMTAFVGTCADANSVDANGWYICNEDAENIPVAEVCAIMTAFSNANHRIGYQIAFSTITGKTYIRRKRENEWRTWVDYDPNESPYKTSGKYVAFGDSVTWGAIWDMDQTTPLYQADLKYQIPTRIAIATGMENDFVNEGIGGIGYYNRSSVGASVTEMILAYDFTGVDLVTVMAGVNDKGFADHPLGTADNPASGTICGAIKSIIDFFSSNYPRTQLVFIQPTPSGHLADPWNGTLAAGWSMNTFDEQVSALCHNEHVGYCSWWDCTMCKNWDDFSGGYSYNPNTGNVTGPNYSHMATPEDSGRLGDYIAGKVAAFFHSRN